MASNSIEGWSAMSWKEKRLQAKQQPPYKNQTDLDNALYSLRQLPPLVAKSEVLKLRELLGECAEGKRFLLQGGDCAERFDDCDLESISNKVKILLQMSFVITYGANIPTVRIGRIAGQYSKPRSSDFETVLNEDGESIEVASYRGDNVNSILPDTASREPDPKRLVEGYFHSSATLNCIKNILHDGLADLTNSLEWDMGFVKNSKRKESYQAMAGKILNALQFMQTVGADPGPVLRSVDLFTSHEGLILDYETALTRDENMNLGAHFLWIGDRTRGLNDAHVEYFRGIANPIGLKVGPTMDPSELQRLLQILNPDKQPGKVTLITRFGSAKVEELLPPLVLAVKEAGYAKKVVWCCDPMHGNTTSVQVSKDKYKTRDFDSVLSELEQCIMIHQREGSFLGGVHFELTGDNVTECTGGPEALTREDLPRRYSTHCDPRLNYAQSIEIAFKLSEFLRERSQVDVEK